MGAKKEGVAEMDEPKATAGSVPADTEQPKEDGKDKREDGMGIVIDRLEVPGPGLPALPPASQMEKLEDALVQFEALCLNGGKNRFRNRLRQQGSRLHTMLAKLGGIA